jgi:hypothetical protein
MKRIKELVSVDLCFALEGTSDALQLAKPLMPERAQKIELFVFVVIVAAKHDPIVLNRCLDKCVGSPVKAAGLTIEIGQSPDFHLSLNVDEKINCSATGEGCHLRKKLRFSPKLWIISDSVVGGLRSPDRGVSRAAFFRPNQPSLRYGEIGAGWLLKI